MCFAVLCVYVRHGLLIFFISYVVLCYVTNGVRLSIVCVICVLIVCVCGCCVMFYVFQNGVWKKRCGMDARVFF